MKAENLSNNIYGNTRHLQLKKQWRNEVLQFIIFEICLLVSFLHFFNPHDSYLKALKPQNKLSRTFE